MTAPTPSPGPTTPTDNGPDWSGPPATLTAPDGAHVVLERDTYGIPTITADTVAGGWWGMGYAAAQDRLWQMEFDRRRATGRWAQVVGRQALTGDILARRLRLADAAQRDVSAMDPRTRESFAAYAEGVNAAALSPGGLPPEYESRGLQFEPWLPWHSVAAFKVRHVLMGAWQYKLARALLFAMEGADVFTHFDPVPREGMRLTTPAGAHQRPPDPGEVSLLVDAHRDVSDAAAEFGFLREVEAGSNAWAVSGGMTASGAPLLASDSHRAAEVPNVYWQARLRTPGLELVGATFPGIPGFPHFGHNGRVGWAITNAAADAQDLVTEAFRTGVEGLQVRTADGWTNVNIDEQTIEVAGSEPVKVRCVSTPNGPVVHGDPDQGRALALRWTATEEPCRQFGVLQEMLEANNVEDLIEAQRGWVDPVNNFLCADTGGNIGYVLRGALPRRRRPASLQVPVPGWEEDSQWDGQVAFEDMPREVNPELGFIASGNNAITDAYATVRVSHAINDFYRIERIHELLEASRIHDAASMRCVQSDTTSIAARRWSSHLAGRGPYEGDAERARASMLDWDGDLASNREAGLVYACFRRALAHQLIAERVGPRGQRLLSGTDIPAGGVLLKRWFAQLIWATDGSTPEADSIPDLDLCAALAGAWVDATAVAGPDPGTWRWRGHHWLEPKHTLAGTPGDEWVSPRPVSAGGDAETVQAAAYGWPRGSSFTVTNTAVYRQILDLGALDESQWVIPGGASGRPGTPHYEDQLRIWAMDMLVPMAAVDGEES